MKNWREAVIRPGESVRAALRKIDRAALRMGFLCDNTNKLLGTISDGDIRRGLLSDAELTDPVDALANPSPLACSRYAQRSEMVNLMQEKQIDVLPLIDGDGRLVDAVTLETLRRPPKRDNPVFIMAGGFGSRLRPLTDSCPKPMLPLGDKPLLEHIVRRFMSQGFWNFYVSTHYMPDVITNHFGDGSDLGVSIKYVTEKEPLGTGGAIGLLPTDINTLPLIMMNGDILTDVDFTEILSSHTEAGADATMCLREHQTSVAYGVVSVEGNVVVDMLEKPTYSHLINTGIYVLSNELVKAVRPRTHLDLPSLLEQRISIGKKISAFKFHGQWIDIGNVADYQRAMREILSGEA